MSLEQRQTSERKVEMNDVFAFGEMLAEARARLDKGHKAIAKELNLNVKSSYNWEDASEFPKEDRLPDIAKAYGLDLTKVIEVYRLSKQAHKLEKEAKKSTPVAHVSKRGSDNEFDSVAPERISRPKRYRTRF